MKYLCIGTCFDKKGNKHKEGDIVEYNDNDYVSKWFVCLEDGMDTQPEDDTDVTDDEQDTPLIEKEPETLSELQKIILPPEPFTQPEVKEVKETKKIVKKSNKVLPKKTGKKK